MSTCLLELVLQTERASETDALQYSAFLVSRLARDKVSELTVGLKALIRSVFLTLIEMGVDCKLLNRKVT